MHKLLRNILLALVPVVLYYGVFVAFEPNNYFGLKQSAEGTDIMAILRNYEEHPQNQIILGDSRTAKLDPAIAKTATGQNWCNMSYGGASLKEQLDLFDWARQQNPQLDSAVFAISFYTLNQSYNHDRKVISALNNPFAYLTNLGYNINMLTNLYDHIMPARSVGASGETMDPAMYEYVTYTDEAAKVTGTVRKTIAEHMQNLRGRVQNWQLNQEQFQRLLDTVALCQEEGIRFIVVLPPAHPDVFTYLVEPYGIDAPMRAALGQLHAAGAEVLDYEFARRGALADDQFYDGFHLDEARGLDAWTQMLFSAIASEEGVTAA